MDQNPYISSRQVRLALRALELRPSRGMGQNFLVSQDALDQIVGAAGLSPTDTAVEVGPGLGVLTWELLRQAERVISVELDRRLAERLRQELPDPRLTIVERDVLRIAPSEILAAAGVAGQPYKVVANLPYAITSPALRHFLEASQPPTLMVVLVQWEVAERISAAPGDLSLLAHAIQVYAEPETVARIPASSFYPVPAVDSAVLRLRVRPQPLVAPADVDALFRTIKAGFLQTRKQLGNGLTLGLRSMGLAVEREQAQQALDAAGIDPARRAETLTLEEWQRLHAHLTIAD